MRLQGFSCSFERKHQRLLKISSQALDEGCPLVSDETEEALGTLGASLMTLWHFRNGFYAFESALHLRSARQTEVWNDKDGWKRLYSEEVKQTIFFAEDLFGNQFGISKNLIHTFDPETGELDQHSTNLKEWVQKILKDPDFETGQALAHEWQMIKGALPLGQRLFPVVPFILDGNFSVDNLHAVEACAGMERCNDMGKQIQDLPDEAAVAAEA